jgi:type IV pilus assembly protein PilV
MRHNFPLTGQRGFTLIEVLVAVVILAIGLLGLAGLQATGLRSNHSAYLRSQASLQAYDIIDRITPTGKNCVGAVQCSPADMADYDLSQWNAANINVMPSGAGVVCRDSTPEDGNSSASPDCDDVAGAPYAVKLWWVDERDGTTQRFVTSFRP